MKAEATSLPPPPPQSDQILRALDIQISRALDEKNLGAWASLQQTRIKYLPYTHPYTQHSSLQMARRLGHIHTWYASVPPRSIVYLSFHIYLHLVYVGVTTSALVTCSRKHMTDATSHQDCASLHKLMLQIDPAHWGILPLQYVSDSWLAYVRERHWWHTFKKWVCNDVAPGISTDGQGSAPRGWLKQRVLSVLHSIKEAKQLRDYARLKYLQQDLHDLAQQLSIPMYSLGAIVVPNLTPLQKAAIHHVTRKIVGSVTSPAWEK